MTDADGASYTAGDDTGFELTIDENPYATQEICDDLYETLNGVIYNPFTMSKAIYDPAAELGDPVLYNGLVYSFIAKEDATLNTTFQATISAPADSEIEDEYPYLSKSDKEISSLKDDVSELVTIVENTVVDSAKVSAAITTAVEESEANILLEVSGTYATKTSVTEAIETAEGYTDTKLESYTSTAEMNTAISEAVSEEVASIFLEASGTYATKTDITEAIETAEGYTDTKLSSYSTTSEMNTAISEAVSDGTADILLEISGTYATTESISDILTNAEDYTDTKLESYSTTTDMNAAIETAISSSEATINSTISVAITDLQEYADSAESDAVSAAEKYTDNKLTSYSTTTDMTNAISQAVSDSESSILLDVSSTYATTATVNAKTTHYGTCSTPAETVAKEAACANFTSLYVGAIVSVLFTYANTAESPTLNVNGTGAMTIRAYNAAIATGSNYNWTAESVVTFVYSGSYWYIADSGALSKAVSLLDTAEEYVDGLLTSYYTTTEVNAAIETAVSNSETSITSSISGTYATIISVSDAVDTSEEYTDTKLASYSTTTQMENAISQAVSDSENSILLEISGTYVTQEDVNEEVSEAVSAYLVLSIETDSNGRPYGTLSANADYINFKAGQFVFESDNFSVDDTGAYFSGTLEVAGQGTIAGFTIGDTALCNSADALISSTDGVWIGTNGISSTRGGYATVIRNGWIELYNNQTLYGGLVPVGSEEYPTLYGQKDGTSALCLGVGNGDSVSHFYLLNTGGDPDGYSHRHQFRDTAVFRGSATFEVETYFTEQTYLQKDTGNTYYRAERTDTGVVISMGVGSGGINHGLYSSALGKWMVYGDDSYVRANINYLDTAPILSLSSGQTMYRATRSDTDVSVGFGVNSAGVNHGVYSFTLGKWIVYASDEYTYASIDRLTFLDYGAIYEESTTKRYPVASVATNGQRVARIGTSLSGSTYRLSVYGNFQTYESDDSGFSDSSTYTYLTRYFYSDSSSDVRLKENIEDTEIEALPVVRQMKLRQFNWRGTGLFHKIGPIADELEELDSGFVCGGGYDDDGNIDPKAINQLYLSSYLAKAIQELDAVVQAQAEEIEALKAMLLAA